MVRGRAAELPPGTAEYVRQRNSEKLLFTPGPASLTVENLQGLRPCFGRGDEDYQQVESRVLGFLKSMTGHKEIVRLQGSGSLALEIVALNFLYGKVVLVDTGYYSDRLSQLLKYAMATHQKVTSVEIVPWSAIKEYSCSADWVWACPTETSEGLGLKIADLRKLATACGAKLALDATASIGLEPNHDLANVISYSSCKGLFGLTGACFIAYDSEPENEVASFYLSIPSHKNKLMTGPYHSIQSLDVVLARHSDLRESVLTNKARFMSRMENDLVWGPQNQPALCTRVRLTPQSRSRKAVLYTPRSGGAGSVICHLGEVGLGRSAKGAILDDLVFEEY